MFPSFSHSCSDPSRDQQLTRRVHGASALQPRRRRVHALLQLHCRNPTRLLWLLLARRQARRQDHRQARGHRSRRDDSDSAKVERARFQPTTPPSTGGGATPRHVSRVPSSCSPREPHVAFTVESPSLATSAPMANDLFSSSEFAELLTLLTPARVNQVSPRTLQSHLHHGMIASRRSASLPNATDACSPSPCQLKREAMIAA